MYVRALISSICPVFSTFTSFLVSSFFVLQTFEYLSVYLPPAIASGLAGIVHVFYFVVAPPFFNHVFFKLFTLLLFCPIF